MAASKHAQPTPRAREGSDAMSISEVLSDSQRSSMRHSGSRASLNLDDSASLGSSGYCNGSGKGTTVLSHSGGASNSSDLGDEEDPEDGDDDGIEKKIRWFFKNIERDEALKISASNTHSIQEEISGDEQLKLSNLSEINQTQLHSSMIITENSFSIFNDSLSKEEGA